MQKPVKDYGQFSVSLYSSEASAEEFEVAQPDNTTVSNEPAPSIVAVHGAAMNQVALQSFAAGLGAAATAAPNPAVMAARGAAFGASAAVMSVSQNCSGTACHGN